MPAIQELFLPLNPNLLEKEVSLNHLLSQVGEPINQAAKETKIKQGDSAYFLTSLPLETAFPILIEATDNPNQVRTAWQEFNRKIASFYNQNREVASVPVWMLDEIKLAQQKSILVESARIRTPGLTVCSTERFCLTPDALHLQINRVIPLTEDNNIVRDDRPSCRAERPGSPVLSQQIKALRQAYEQNGRNGLLLEDTGLASGGSIKTIAEMLETQGVPVTKVVGGLAWYPQALKQLESYNPEALIWFDLTKGGWVENRDFPVLPQTGILVAETHPETQELRLTKRFLSNGLPIGFTVPNIAFGGRWFRATDIELIQKIKTLCLQETLSLVDAINPELTIGQLAEIYDQAGILFTLPVNFGNLSEQLSEVAPGVKFSHYLIKNFT